MKKVALTLIFLLMCSFAYADNSMTVKVFDSSNVEVSSFQLTDSEVIALLTITDTVEGWIERAVKNRAYKAIEKVIVKSGEGSAYTPNEDRDAKIQDLKARDHDVLKTALELEAELGTLNISK
jgi:hypothetical protein